MISFKALFYSAFNLNLHLHLYSFIHLIPYSPPLSPSSINAFSFTLPHPCIFHLLHPSIQPSMPPPSNYTSHSYQPFLNLLHPSSPLNSSFSLSSFHFLFIYFIFFSTENESFPRQKYCLLMDKKN